MCRGVFRTAYPLENRGNVGSRLLQQIFEVFPKTEIGAHHGFTTGVEFGVKGKRRCTLVGKVHIDKTRELPVERHENGVELFFASFSALRNLKCGSFNASPVHFHK